MKEYHLVNHRGGLPRVNKRLLQNEPIIVAFLGGSITEGYGASDPDRTSWRALTGAYLKERFPAKEFDFINAGVGGTTSSFGAHRLQEHVLSKGDIDLLFVEFSMNDGEDLEESIRGMEGIVRQCRRLSPRTDICFVYTAGDKNLSEELPFNIAVHEKVASHYDIPSVNFAGKVYASIQTGSTLWEQLAPDRVHPNDAGYAFYASCLRDYLDMALSSNGEGIYDLGTPLPLPLDTRSYEYADMVDFSQAERLTGLERKGLKPEPLINWRYDPEHLYTDLPGASFSFTIEGQSAGLLLLCGPDTGIFEYSIDDGNSFHPVNLFDGWCENLFRPIIALFPIQDDRKSMRVTIRNTAMKDDRSAGTTLRVLKLLSN
jgi:acyl-CoA thioesterase I